MKLLIFIPSPRDIPEVEEAHSKVSEDKIWIKYVGYDDKPNPYQRAVNYFLNHPEYTHFAISPDDLVITQEGVDTLMEDIKKKKLRCVMGICNVDTTDMNRLAVTKHKVQLERQGRVYEFLRKEDLEGKRFIKAGWCGTPFAVFDRELVKSLVWVGDTYKDSNKGKGIQAFDVGISYQLHEMKIPVTVDLSVNFYHMRYGGKKYVGIKADDVWIDIVGQPRIKNDNTRVREIEEAYKVFVENNGLGNEWTNELMAKLVSGVVNAIPSIPSQHYQETLEVKNAD